MSCKSCKRFEQLESRLALAGDVVAAIVDGTLQITGDRGDNNIEIRQNASGDWQLTGRGNTEINGERRVTLNADQISDLQINLGAGADTARILRSQIAGDLTIATDGGSDTLELQRVSVAGDIEANFGAGRDFVKVDRLTVDGNVVLRQGSDNDTVFASNSDFGGNFRVNSGAGNDQVHFDRVNLAGNVRLLAGDGNDQLNLRRSEMAGLTIDGGAGTDRAVLDSIFGSLAASVDLGAGRDRLEIRRSEFLGGIEITPEDQPPQPPVEFVNGTPGGVPGGTTIDRGTPVAPVGTTGNVASSQPRTTGIPTQLVSPPTNPVTGPTVDRFGNPISPEQAPQLIELLGIDWFYNGGLGY